MQALQVLFWSIVLIGHSAACVATSNRLHATRLSRPILKFVDKIIYLWMFVFSLLWIWTGFPYPSPWTFSLEAGTSVPAAIFLGVALVIGIVVIATRIVRLLHGTQPACLLSNDTERVDVATVLDRRPAEGRIVRILDCLPGNQMFHLHVHTKQIVIPELDTRLDGLTIAHLSDLHFTGRVARTFFDYLVDRTNDFDADLVVITGDLIDNPDCLSWVAGTLGRLRSRHGVYFVLGNHDVRVKDQARLLSVMAAADLIHVGRQCKTIETNQARILLAGNELPWYRPAPTDLPGPEETQLRMLLSHSPDQIVWARRNRFDIVLAGHTHGGQIRLPLIGPIVSPSRFGIKYAGGVFEEGKTIMQVSRGVSGKNPLRFNCPPELSKIVLASGRANAESQV